MIAECGTVDADHVIRVGSPAGGNDVGKRAARDSDRGGPVGVQSRSRGKGDCLRTNASPRVVLCRKAHFAEVKCAQTHGNVGHINAYRHRDAGLVILASADISSGHPGAS